MKQLTIHNQRNAIEIGSHIRLADTTLSRLVGLLGRKRLDAGCGVLLKPSSGVHTFGMRFPIDVVALDEGFSVVSVWESLKPYKVTGMRLGTRTVLEVAPGQIRRCDIQIGDRLEIAASKENSG